MSEENTSTDDSTLTSRLANDPRLESLLNLDSMWVDRGLTIAIFLIAILLLFETRKYDWEAQRVPVFVFGLVLILSFVEILKQFGIVDWGADSDSGASIRDDLEERTVGEETPLAYRRVEVLRMITWIVGFLVIVWVIGLLPGSLLFLVAFYYLEAAVGLLRTIVYSGVVFLFVWAIFEVMLKARLYPGIFELGEFFYISGSLF